MKDNLKILQVIDKLDPGGAERVFVDMSNILVSKNQHVSCLFLTEKGHLGDQLDSRINCYELNRLNKLSIFKMFQCAQVIKQFDIIHCHMRHVYRYVKLVSRLFLLRQKIILHEHSGSISPDSGVPVFFKTFFKPSFLIGVSQNHLTWARHRLGLSECNVHYLPNIIIKRNDTAPRKDILPSDLVLVGNIKENKNQLFALDIVSNYQWSLNIFGRNQDEAYNRKLNDRIKSSSGNIRIYYDIDDVQNSIKTARIGLSTSVYESGPLVLLEFLSAGMPFVAYKTGEIAEIISAYFPEFFLDSFSVEQWRARIELLLSSTYNKEALTNVFQKLSSSDEYYNKLSEIYSSVCAS